MIMSLPIQLWEDEELRMSVVADVGISVGRVHTDIQTQLLESHVYVVPIWQ